MSDILLEKYLASQFKFGFELEAFCRGVYEQYDDQEVVDAHVSSDIADAFKFPINDIEIKHDGSLDPYENEDYAFEWATPPMNFTPTNLKRSIDGLEILFDNEYYVNNTCGFHVHLSFPNISDQDAIWIIMNLALDKEMRKKLERFKNYHFYSDEYANTQFLDDISYYWYNGSYEDLSGYFTTEKYRAYHIHPQGTIEWRGPRKFLSAGKKTITGFFKLLHEFVMWMSKTISSNEIQGISKENFFKMVFDEHVVKHNNYIHDFNKQVSFDKVYARIEKDVKNNNYETFKILLKKFEEDGTQAVLTYCKALSNMFYSAPEYDKFAKNICKEYLNMDDKYIDYSWSSINEKLSIINIVCLYAGDYDLFLSLVKLYIRNYSNCAGIIVKYFNNRQATTKEFIDFYRRYGKTISERYWKKALENVLFFKRYSMYVDNELISAEDIDDFINIAFKEARHEGSYINFLTSFLNSVKKVNINYYNKFLQVLEDSPNDVNYHIFNNIRNENDTTIE